MGQKLCDTCMTVNLYSGFGTHTIYPGNRIIYKLGYSDKYFRDRIREVIKDSLILYSGERISITQLGEIGYYSKTDKIVRMAGSSLFILAGILLYQYSLEYDKTKTFVEKAGGTTPTVVTISIGAAMTFMRRKTYKIPKPWQIQTSQPVKLLFDYK